jgi:metal-sulfur cluster biosynthetic enzyme
MEKREEIQKAIVERLQSVIDPETGVDVVRMRLVEALSVGDDGTASYIFRPSSPVCPIAVSLAVSIRSAVAEVPGVRGQRITVEGYVGAEELTTHLAQLGTQ